MLWATRIAKRTLLMPSIPEWTTYLAGTVLVGLIFAGRALYSRSIEKTPKHIANSFVSGCCVGFVCFLNSYDVLAYLLPSATIHYDSTFEVTYPGPSNGRTSRCEAGVRINDPKTGRSIRLCTDKAALERQLKPGMSAVRVTAQSNSLGSYISGYQFIYQ
ncbi:hypothetical protein DYL61_29525 [Pseudomonas nabeulensis]|uniref:Uncharacterized protein n=2 Tax=Pseudomonas nabeulensis TaxID=2293833 RepID=A0A4Z0AFW6_9PSED|nr:hypothetical protein DYL61_29525 [Pseudomonas nabeulensis]